MEKNIYCAELTDSQKAFLDEYKPVNEDFTTNEEVAKISSMFALETYKDTEQLRAIRNGMVKYFSEKRNDHQTIAERWDNMNALQSVTAVVDHFMYNLRAESV